MRSVAEFDIVDHGIEGSQYFRGCGVAHTAFSECATGVGDNPAEAIDDCLEMMAQADVETEGMENRIMQELGLTELPVSPSKCHGCENAEYAGAMCEGERWSPCEACEVHYFLSILYNLGD